jgi:predicted RND superfamily exporter protein
MDLGLYEILKNLSKEYPNDMQFGAKVRTILKEMGGDIDSDLLSTLVGKQEMETLKEKMEPTEEEILKLEKFLSNIKTKEDGIQ